MPRVEKLGPWKEALRTPGLDGAERRAALGGNVGASPEAPLGL
jgi:hypothetical protein